MGVTKLMVKKMMTRNIIISGFGGQGIVAAGKTLIYAAMMDGMNVSMLPSYGPEMRGGFANCHVIISESSIACPIISSPDIVIAMSVPAFEKFESNVKSEGTLIIDSHLVGSKSSRDDITSLYVPATKAAMEVGSAKFANVVMLGVLMQLLDCPAMESMKKAIMNMLPDDKKDLLDKEMEALSLGMEYARQIVFYYN